MRISIIYALVLFCGFTFAQEDTESAAETISKSLRDFQSEDAEVRKRAVLILGKYPSTVAKRALLTALTDKEAGIRRSALVSLNNWMVEKPIFSANEVEQLMMMIGDADVSIRRIASSALPQLLMRHSRQRSIIISPNQVQTRSKLPPVLVKVLRDASRDDDATVRKNLVSAWLYLRQYIPDELALERLKDKNREVRILALERGKMILPRDVYERAVVTMVDDPDRIIRLRLATVLGRQFGAGGKTVQALQALAEDKDFEISTEAYIGLMRHTPKTAAAELMKRLEDPQMRGEQAKNIIEALPRAREVGMNYLLRLVDHEKSKYRLTAFRTYVQRFWGKGNPELAMKMVDDPASAIRGEAIELLARSQSLTLKTVAKLAQSKYDDVRRAALVFSHRLPKNEALEEVVMGLLIDESAEVRRLAIFVIGSREMTDWVQIMGDALGDEDKDSRQQAALTLIEKRDENKEADKLIKRYLEKGGNDELKTFIKKEIENRSLPIIPPPTLQRQ